ncbi:PREDICTED: WAP, Kazal, immunoglobulin, Kunitz and NTR domain-containing protein 2-like [Poecilia mexicana]|uniref:WAP, follistatin/kazal, immunoglobulin, kunitz and netrin domain containing 2b n=1 Tax=Poecilia mexicana TaxID=48701 RepID=A0A3B3YKV5_9TELE|nr:PREDICTED: WAP, Kazal, immunoglobulin, Kunitz and NTR domain-containing protein 2-like [Poecilia mexicana]
MRWMLFPRWIWFLACASARMELGGAALPRVTYSHAGICPNEMNPNLWVDAMSTCTRECDSDEECESFEKCCQNVCGNHSCVAARYVDGKKGPVGMPREASCASFMCTQQGSECVIWEGRPLCKCRDRCEKEPNFTCASDGMTYYNKCFMDAEACSKGITLSVVLCRFHLTWPNMSPLLPQLTTVHPTTTPFQPTVPLPLEPEQPVLVTSPIHQTVNVGETASFLCDVTGQPQPQIMWEKRLPLGDVRVIMRPNNVLGNMVVTNIGQLVIYNTRLQDSGVYTCIAQNPSGSVQVHHPLTVLSAEVFSTLGPKNLTRCLPEECQNPFDNPEDCGTELEKVSWYYEPKSNNCFPFRHCHSSNDQSPRKVFDTYEGCIQCCGPELSRPCRLPALQGRCKAYEPRWAYISTMGKCQSFIYGGCEGNDNNFESKQLCEEMCPFQKNHQCKACKPRGKMVTSFCRSDFVVLGRMTDITQEKDSGHALVTVEEIFKDEKMGLRFFGKEPLEVTFLNMDWNCPCPNITGTAAEGQVIIMGNVSEGMAVLQPESYVGASTPRRVRKLKEVISKNTCNILKAITNSPQ